MNKVVIFRTDRIGEVILSSVVIDAIKKYKPDADITFVTSEYSKPLLSGRRDVSEILTVDTMNRGKCFRKAVTLAKILKKRQFDTAIILNPHKVLHLACFLAGIPVRAGYNRKWRFLLNKKIEDERDKGEKHEVEYALELLRVLGVNVYEVSPRIIVTLEAEIFIKNIFLAEKLMDDKKIIAIHPGTSNPCKMWGSDRYAELIRRLKEKEPKCVIAVLGDKRECSLAETIIKKSGADVLNFAGKFDLQQLAAFLKRSAFFIGNDTGPMHMAAALGITVIAIFGRDIPETASVRWRPWGTKHIVFHAKENTPDAVLKAACQILTRIKQEARNQSTVTRKQSKDLTEN